MTKERYFKKEYDEEYYIFDSTKISKEEVDIESEYGYDVFANAMQGDEVVDLLNKLQKENKQLKEQLQNIQKLFDDTIQTNEKIIEWGKNMSFDVGDISFHNAMLKIMKDDLK